MTSDQAAYVLDQPQADAVQELIKQALEADRADRANRAEQAVESVGAQASAASLKLPEFFAEDPELWFGRIEAQFGNKGITQDTTKFNYVYGALDFATCKEVRPVLKDPPDEGKYEALKAALIEVFGKDQAEKDAMLLHIPGLGDQNGSALWRRIQSLNHDPSSLKRAIFLDKLPAEMRSTLAVNDKLFKDNMQDLVKAVDAIVRARSCSNHVNQVSTDNPQEAAAVQRHKQPRQQPQAKQEKSGTLCYFHTRWGRDARNCVGDWCLGFHYPRPQGKPSGDRDPDSQGNAQAGRR